MMEWHMDLKNLPSRYSQTSNEMQGSKDALDMIRAQSKDVVKGINPSVVSDRELATVPGFLKWKDDQPVLSIKGNRKITGQDFDLEKALEEQHSNTPQAAPIKQGKPVEEFPNVKPLVVTAEKKEDIKAELGQAEEPSKLDTLLFSSNTRKLVTMLGVFGLGVYVGRWLALRS